MSVRSDGRGPQLIPLARRVFLKIFQWFIEITVSQFECTIVSHVRREGREAHVYTRFWIDTCVALTPRVLFFHRNPLNVTQPQLKK